MSERHVSELLAEVFRRAGMKRNLKRAEAVLLWPRVVGPEVARFSSARALRDGILYVDVTDSETAMHLSLQRSRFLAVYQGEYGTGVREIRFQVGRVGRDDEEPEPPAEPARPDPQELAELARGLGELDLPPEVAQVALQAGRRFLGLKARRRAAGWLPCPTCGALHDGPVRPLTPREEALAAAGRRDEGVELARELCAACRRYADEGRVRAAAGQLKVAPGTATPGLSDDERAVAAHLAVRDLDVAIRELMPAAVENPRIVPQLERAARNRVALASGKAPEAVEHHDIERYDTRLALLLRRLGG
ncbi:MAG: DUF721 domain-containing protein [Deinococcales bacterium]|nr:DUF721 domain-containing protein [Deinococcales bacterium]